MDTFDMPMTMLMPIQIITTSLHEITHHDLYSPHCHSPVFFTYHTHTHTNNEEMNNNNNDDKMLELFMLMSQSWT